jgi:hypothetical protein
MPKGSRPGKSAVECFKDGTMEFEIKCLPNKPVVKIKVEGDLLKRTTQITENSGVAEGFQITVVPDPVPSN